MQKTAVYLDAEDREAIKKIQQQYGVTSAAAAVRLALRQMAGMQPPKPKRNHPWRTDPAGVPKLDQRTQAIVGSGGPEGIARLDKEINELEAERLSLKQQGHWARAQTIARRQNKLREIREYYAKQAGKADQS